MTSDSNGATLEALVVAVSTRTPVLLWGSPGTGKSAAVSALAQHLGLALEVVLASIREPSDFAGLPVVSDGSVRFAPPRWAERLQAAGSGVLFLDEITTAPPAVQSALLRVCLDRVVGDLALPPSVAVVAAANPPELAAGGWDLSAPLANRFVHLGWAASVLAFAQGMTGEWPEPPMPTVHLDDSVALDASAQASRAAVGGFVLSRPDLLLKVPKDGGVGRAWPSPRSWEMAARLWGAAEAMAVSEESRLLLLAGSVGEGAASEFVTWLDDAQTFDVVAMLEDPDGCELPTRADRLLVVLDGVVRVAIERADAGAWDAGWRLVSRATDIAADVAATAARRLARNRPPGADLPGAVLDRLAPVVAAAGLG